METKLVKIAQLAKDRPKEQFTSLIHLLDEEALYMCHQELRGDKAVGVDEVTKARYEENLCMNLKKLHHSLRQMAYKPQPVRRVYIPKPGSKKMRPLGIPAYEDKIVQLAVSKILSALYEQDFLNFSFGFRPGLGCHDALRMLNTTIMTKKTNWVVDADISGFFDHVDHSWMIKCLEVRIKDRKLLQLIQRMLKAGMMEEGILRQTEQGTPQGGIISPVLANVYLHYVLDLWFEKRMKKQYRGQTYMVRYADDFVCCFQSEGEARNFYLQLKDRLKKFNLEIAPEKSKIMEFGQFAAQNKGNRGEGRPETFDFLGFTHYCGKSRNGKFRVKRQTSRKKFQAALNRMKVWIKANRTLPVKSLMDQLKAKLTGHYRYYGITDNGPMLSRYWYGTMRLLFKWLNRRSQRNSYTWDKFLLLMEANPLPKPRIYSSMFGGKALV
ncbi:group II intron reverse transcriptase/maturase [Paenibacillus sp. N4]|uniref:group II intron reverse transcriptase/maturase n=1 Tax=Paenibacillus vietnamensis TaxID=2590547 RepID=UPI001CD0CAF5|nr:group II intron reverse transcriptase/maturase [Paenibacillus vietnamensis]MCA0755834.1 group II intron reverse transcriptase/maturase [Paenibacillus vietnamensis]MCA0755835.1 group II intron reverse transcriptase/maturase [Paenibacillus vietnamensis]